MSRQLLGAIARHSIRSRQRFAGQSIQLPAVASKPQTLSTIRSLVALSRIFITHMHGDHIFGLPGLLRAICRRVKQQPADYVPNIVRIFGPPGA